MYEHERSLVKLYKDKPFVLLGVNSDKDRSEIKTVIKAEQLTWRSWWNGGSPSGPIARAWGVNAWPTVFLIDPKGVVRYKLVGGQGLDEALAKLVNAADRDVAKKPVDKGAGDAVAANRRAASKPTEAPGRQEQVANAKLEFAQTLLDNGKAERARQRLKEVIEQYPSTSAAKEAQRVLDALK
jgi:hypothetical protein